MAEHGAAGARAFRKKKAPGRAPGGLEVRESGGGYIPIPPMSGMHLSSTLRTLARPQHRAYATAVVVTLALGIGAVTAMFGLAEALRGLGRAAEAEKTLEQARKAWVRADVDLPQIKGVTRNADEATSPRN